MYIVLQYINVNPNKVRQHFFKDFHYLGETKLHRNH